MLKRNRQNYANHLSWPEIKLLIEKNWIWDRNILQDPKANTVWSQNNPSGLTQIIDWIVVNERKIKHT